MHFLYQYSLHFFLDIYHTVLYENANLKSVSDHMQRLSLITKDLFQVKHFVMILSLVIGSIGLQFAFYSQCNMWASSICFFSGCF